MTQKNIGEIMATNEHADKSPKIVAGFWIRVVADIIDMAILWVFAFLLSFVLESWFLRLGENGVWLGLLISIIYFVPMQSSFGNGQSLGKRLLSIQVLGMDGKPLTLPRSFLRYLIIAFVAYIGVFAGIANLMASSTWSAAVNSVIGTLWVIALVGCYLLLPLHPLKRGLHDLASGSVVVYRNQFNAAALTALANPAKTKKAFLIVGTLLALTVALGVWGILAIKKNVALVSMQEIQTELESTGRFHSTSVMDNNFKINSVNTRSIIVQTHVDGPLNQTKDDLKPYYDLAFQAIHDHVKDPTQYNYLRVGLRLGYNLGIRKRFVTFFQDENPNKPGERRDGGSNKNF